MNEEKREQKPLIGKCMRTGFFYDKETYEVLKIDNPDDYDISHGYTIDGGIKYALDSREEWRQFDPDEGLYQEQIATFMGTIEKVNIARLAKNATRSVEEHAPLLDFDQIMRQCERDHKREQLRKMVEENAVSPSYSQMPNYR